VGWCEGEGERREICKGQVVNNKLYIGINRVRATMVASALIFTSQTLRVAAAYSRPLFFLLIFLNINIFFPKSLAIQKDAVVDKAHP